MNFDCMDESKIHPTAIINHRARIGINVEVGPYSVIGPNVEVGDCCRIASHVVIDGNTIIGSGNRFFTGAVIGMEPQDMKYRGEKSFVLIGDNNTFREYVTVNRGTSGGGGVTKIGSHTLIMAYTHIAHDCIIGDNVIIANSTNMAGHVVIEDNAVLNGATGIVQYIRVGRLAMTGGVTKLTKDLPPYVIADGVPGRIRGVNLIGLERNGVTEPARLQIKKAFKILYRSGLTVDEAITRIESACDACPEVLHLVAFLRNSAGGIMR
ncbi:MAG: acyl-ACP--UDP-N-acetylglucosamine O-acyltransferase [Desulfotomaculaceae bacterium]